MISGQILKRIFTGRGADENGMLPVTYQWDLLSDKGELAKGGWAASPVRLLAA